MYKHNQILCKTHKLIKYLNANKIQVDIIGHKIQFKDTKFKGRKFKGTKSKDTKSEGKKLEGFLTFSFGIKNLSVISYVLNFGK